MKGIRILQIYLDVNMGIYRGEHSIRAFLHTKGNKQWQEGDVFMFFNKARNIVKVFSPVDGGMYQENLPANQTWDLTLRKNQLLSSIGKAFGLHWNVEDAVYEPLREKEKHG